MCGDSAVEEAITRGLWTKRPGSNMSMCVWDIFGSQREMGEDISSLGEIMPNVGFWPWGPDFIIFVDKTGIRGLEREGAPPPFIEENTWAIGPWSIPSLSRPWGVRIRHFWELKVSGISSLATDGVKMGV